VICWERLSADDVKGLGPENKRIYPMKKWLWMLLTVVCGLGIAEAKTVDRILVQVNDDIITLSELNREMVPVRRELESKYSGAELDEAVKKAEKQVLESLIQQRLLLQKANELGVGSDVESEVAATLQRILKEYKLKDLDELEQALEQQGKTLREYREDLRKQIITSGLVDQFVRSRIAIMSQEIERYYKDHAADYSTPEEVSLSEIIISNTGDDKEAESRANDIYSRLVKGESFATLASQYSKGPTANKGGSIGTNILAKWGPDTVGAIAGLKEGDISKPQKIKEGYVIYRIDSRRFASVRPLEEIRGEIRNRLFQMKFDPEYERFINQLKDEFPIQDYSDAK
jgi:peptidyl-prolyl cis-trans isomerase SurA